MAAIQFRNSADIPVLVLPTDRQHIPLAVHSGGAAVHNQKLTRAAAQLPSSQLEISADFVQFVPHTQGGLRHCKRNAGRELFTLHCISAGNYRHILQLRQRCAVVQLGSSAHKRSNRVPVPDLHLNHLLN